MKKILSLMTLILLIFLGVSFLGYSMIPGKYQQAPLNIKITSCPNPINIKNNDEMSVTILGTDSFDVTRVDTSSIQIEGVRPLFCSYKDMTSRNRPSVKNITYSNNPSNYYSDGIMDLVLNFDKKKVVQTFGEINGGECLVLSLKGNLVPEFGCSPFIGEDMVTILENNKWDFIGDLNGTWDVRYTDDNADQNPGLFVFSRQGDRLIGSRKDCNIDTEWIFMINNRSIVGYPELDCNVFKGFINYNNTEIVGIHIIREGDEVSKKSWRMVKISNSMDYDHNCYMMVQGDFLGQPVDLAGPACARMANKQGHELICIDTKYNNYWLSLYFEWNHDHYVKSPLALAVGSDNCLMFLKNYYIWKYKNPNRDKPVKGQNDEIYPTGGNLTIIRYDGDRFYASYNLSFADDNTHIMGYMDADRLVGSCSADNR